MLNRDFANTTSVIGARTLQPAAIPQNQPNWGLMLAQGLNAYNEQQAAKDEAERLGAYGKALKEQHPEDAARIDAMGALEAGAYYDDIAQKEREQQNKLALLAQENQYMLGREAQQHRNAINLAQMKMNIEQGMAQAERERQLAYIDAQEKAGLMKPEQANMARARLNLGDIAKGIMGDVDNPYGSTPFGVAMNIVGNPDKFNETQVKSATQFLNKLDPDYLMESSFQKAAGKAQGEYAGSRMNDQEKGYIFENGQKYPVAGTIAEDEYLTEYSKNLSANDEAMRVSQTVLDDIAAVKRMIKENPYAAASWGSMTSFMPGTPAHNIKARIESIKGNSGVDSLLMIKKSGAGLGQIPQAQMNMLSSMMGNLDQAQSLPELEDVINRYERIYQNVYDNAENTNKKIMGKIRQPSQQGNISIPSDEDAWGGI